MISTATPAQGVVGRKRVVLLAPDVFPASSKVLRSPDMECQQLKPLSTLSEEALKTNVVY